MILIVGAKGNMGKRYASICDYLNQPYGGLDVNDSLHPLPAKITHVIIATPTNTHLELIRYLCSSHMTPLKILCEKPIATGEVKHVLDAVKESKHELFMVNQYAYYSHEIGEHSGITEYDYYNSGGDGIFWDCIQLIYLSKGKIKLSNKSPIWFARINGVSLDRETIDLCYIKMIDDFRNDGKIYDRRWGAEQIIEAHKKVQAYGQSVNWSAGEIDFYEATREV